MQAAPNGRELPPLPDNMRFALAGDGSPAPDGQLLTLLQGAGAGGPPAPAFAGTENQIPAGAS